jgi:hypothetical protein
MCVSLPLATLFENADPPLKVMRHGLQVAKESGLLGLNRCDQSVVIRAAAAAPGSRRQRCRGADIAIAQPTA